jgi:N-acetylneuraminate synthase
VENSSTAGKILVIAEAGVNHNGSLKRAVAMVDAAADAGADAVKFQTFRTDEMVTASAPTAAYQATATGGETSQATMLRKLELDRAAHEALIRRCGERSIMFLSTPFDLPSLKLLATGLRLGTLKFSSGDLNNGPLLLAAARAGCRLIVSTGMSTMDEVAEALGVIAFGLRHPKGMPENRAALAAARTEPGMQARLADIVTLLQCTSAYPTEFDEVHLRVMDTLASTFGVPVGFSDHTPGIVASLAAAARGARIIEKHFTLDRELPGPDQAASLEPDEIAELIRSVRIIERVLGQQTDKTPSPAEQDTAAVARKSIVAACYIGAGEILTEENLAVKRPGTGLSPMGYWDLLGGTAQRDYQRDEPIES